MADTKLSDILKKLTYNEILRAYGIDAESGYFVPNEILEQKIYEPTTEPVISLGTPNTLVLDLNNARQAMFEPRLSVGTRSINVDFTFSTINDSNAIMYSKVLSLTGTRAITFSSSYLCSNASSIGEYTGNVLTLTAGTDDLIEFQFLLDKTSSKWLFKVAEVAA